MDENLARWIFASIAKHFRLVASGLSLPYFVEGVDERDETTMRENHVELRITGPFIREYSKNYFKASVPVNAFFTERMAMSGADAYDIVRWCGKFQSVMLDPVPVYKYGPGPGDDNSLIGCLKPTGSNDNMARIYHFGQVSKEDRIRQSEVDILYWMEV